MISRRGILGTFLAAPVIIRTPGLLMAIKPQASIGPRWYVLDEYGMALSQGQLRDLLLPGIRAIEGSYVELAKNAYIFGSYGS